MKNVLLFRLIHSRYPPALPLPREKKFESVPTWVVLWGFNRFAIFPFENEKPVNYGNEYNFYL